MIIDENAAQPSIILPIKFERAFKLLYTFEKTKNNYINVLFSIKFNKFSISSLHILFLEIIFSKGV